MVDVGQAEVLQSADTEAGVWQAGAQHVHRVVLPANGTWLLGYNNTQLSDCVHNYGYNNTQLSDCVHNYGYTTTTVSYTHLTLPTKA